MGLDQLKALRDEFGLLYTDNDLRKLVNYANESYNEDDKVSFEKLFGFVKKNQKALEEKVKMPDEVLSKKNP